MSRPRPLRLGRDARGAGAPLILLQGLAWGRVHWDDALCDALASKGFRVWRVDHRDGGESERAPAQPPSIGRVVQAAFAGQPVSDAPYLLTDMAADLVAFMDEQGIERAHVCGCSLGGAVAQVLALEHPERVASLTSVMSSTGDPSLLLSSGDALELLFTPLPIDREPCIEHQVKAFRLLAGPTFDEARTRRIAASAFDLQAHVPGPERQLGAARQLVALLASGDRAAALDAVEAPALVVHGDLDPLVDASAGRGVADAIPGAEWLLLEGMGHDLTPPFWTPLVEALVALQARAG
ncbi:MAG: alpha/beta fold hydrolase [Myxococcales bacterium]|nr:alpha/beta fold hydrolase [Myxococcales bacterium]